MCCFHWVRVGSRNGEGQTRCGLLHTTNSWGWVEYWVLCSGPFHQSKSISFLSWRCCFPCRAGSTFRDQWWKGLHMAPEPRPSLGFVFSMQKIQSRISCLVSLDPAADFNPSSKHCIKRWDDNGQRKGFAEEVGFKTRRRSLMAKLLQLPREKHGRRCEWASQWRRDQKRADIEKWVGANYRKIGGEPLYSTKGQAMWMMTDVDLPLSHVTQGVVECDLNQKRCVCVFCWTFSHPPACSQFPFCKLSQSWALEVSLVERKTRKG